jgi:hypothetical protein
MAMNIQVVVFWVVTPCSEVEGYRRFHFLLKMEGDKSFETFVSYINAWHIYSEDDLN